MTLEIYKIFQSDYTFFSSAPGTFSKTDHILGCKANLNKYKKSEMTFCISSDHIRIKLEINNKRNSKKFKHMKTERSLKE
jgi:hypothetical protein